MNRVEAISYLEDCFKDLSEAVCHEQATVIDSHIRGFSKASVMFNAINEDEFSEIEKGLNYMPPVKPKFLDQPE